MSALNRRLDRAEEQLALREKHQPCEPLSPEIRAALDAIFEPIQDAQEESTHDE